MKINIKGRFLRTDHIWFEEYNEKSPNVKADVCFIHANPVELQEGVTQKQLSLISDLSGGIESLKLSKTVKQEINRSIKENVQVAFFHCEELRKNKDILNAFATSYHDMYQSKGMENVFLNMRDVKGYIAADAFLLSVAYVEDSPVVFHSYVCDASCVRLLHSCSTFREGDQNMRNAVGRANKYLHCRDMEYFHSKGMFHYDWGGIVSYEEPNGIDKFKIAFGGTPVEYYNIRILKSLKAKALYKLMKKS